MATRVTKWTDEKIRALKLPADKAEQALLVEPGLYLRMRRTGDETAKQWRYRAQVGGVRKWLSLGSFPAVGLAKARSELRAHETTHEAAKKGEADHPVTAARFARKAARAQLTVAETFDEWIADKRLGSARKGGAPVRERTIAVLKENFDLDIRDRIGDLKIAKLTREGVQSCIDACRKRGSPGAAAHVFRTLRGLVNFAIKRGLVEIDPMRGIENPRPYRPAPVVAATDEEIRALLRVIDDSKLMMSTRLLVEWLMLTGVRSGEGRLAVWSEIDVERSLWTIPAARTKSNREHKVHLSPQALAVIERAKILHDANETNVFRQSPPGDAYLFPGSNPRAGGPVEKMAVARALARLTDRIGKKLRPHDLRRTLRTLMARIGVQPHIAELCLGHVEREVLRRIYDGHDYKAEMAEAWDRAGAHVAALRKGGAAVVPITRGKAA